VDIRVPQQGGCLMQPDPTSITTRKFARRLFGLDAKAVYQFRGEVADALIRMHDNERRLIGERNDAQAALKAANVQIEVAAQEATKLDARIRSYQEREASITRTLVLAEEARHEIIVRAQAEAEKSVATARADASEIVNASHQTAAKLLGDARQLARHTLESAKRAAEAKLALAGVESRLLVAESGAIAARIDHLTRQGTAALISQIEAIVAEHDTAKAPGQWRERLSDLRSELDAIKTLIVELEAEILPNRAKPDHG
jgi:cell division septum initiation protein DivIVA